MAPRKSTRGAKKQRATTRSKSSTIKRPRIKRTPTRTTRMKNVSDRSTVNDFRNFNNPEMRAVLRCSDTQLSELKAAFKHELQTTMVGGLPFLGQLPREVDANGVLQSQMWSRVANSKKTFGNMLSGAMWTSGKRPENFEQRLQRVKRKIERDITNETRRRRGTAAYSEAPASGGGDVGAQGMEKERLLRKRTAAYVEAPAGGGGDAGAEGTGRDRLLRKRTTSTAECSQVIASDDESDGVPRSGKRRRDRAYAPKQSADEDESDGESDEESSAFASAFRTNDTPDEVTSSLSVSAADADANADADDEDEYGGDNMYISDTEVDDPTDNYDDGYKELSSGHWPPIFEANDQNHAAQPSPRLHTDGWPSYQTLPAIPGDEQDEINPDEFDLDAAMAEFVHSEAAAIPGMEEDEAGNTAVASRGQSISQTPPYSFALFQNLDSSSAASDVQQAISGIEDAAPDIEDQSQEMSMVEESEYLDEAGNTAAFSRWQSLGQIPPNPYAPVQRQAMSDSEEAASETEELPQEMPVAEELEYRVGKAAEAKTLQLIALLASLESRFAGLTAEVRQDLVSKLRERYPESQTNGPSGRLSDPPSLTMEWVVKSRVGLGVVDRIGTVECRLTRLGRGQEGLTRAVVREAVKELERGLK